MVVCTYVAMHCTTRIYKWSLIDKDTINDLTINSVST